MIEMPTHWRFQDLRGRRYGRLTVIAYGGPSPWNRDSLWDCLCDCGTTTRLPASRFKRANTKSCGCLGRESRIRHGRSRTNTYRIWWGIISRTTHRGCTAYKNYGARGITVCDRWRRFEAFLADMGERPSVKHSIDRINPRGNYEPGNCRWALQDTQNRNRIDNHWVTIAGRTQCMTDWARELNVPTSTLSLRLRRWLAAAVLP